MFIKKQIQQTIQKSGTLTEKHTVNLSHKAITIHSFCRLSYDRSTLSSEACLPLPPTLNTQIKIYKKNESIRPVINNIHAPTYTLPNFSATSLQKLYNYLIHLPHLIQPS